MNAELIGSVAAALTTLSFVPQAIRVLRTGDTAAISLAMYAMFVVGIALWEVYGLMIGSLPVIVSNIVTFVLSGLILVQKIRHELRKSRG
ncbi:MAG: SemiSWEET transporter [Parvularculaceae bacterium]|nr:SemiSWEET transporter [Parvularculaceae bacterium]